MTRHLRLIVLAALVLTVTSTVAWRFYGPGGSSRVDTLSVAIASRDGSTVTDQATTIKHRDVRRFRADAAATATASCAGCTARAVSVQIVYARSVRTATVENVATAWSSCTGCSSGALSLQVVVADRANTVVADNRAIAANVACTGCTTTAIAYQIVVVSPSGQDLSPGARNRIDAIRDQLETTLSGARGAPIANRPRIAAVGSAAADQLARIVTADTGAPRAVVHSDVQHG